MWLFAFRSASFIVSCSDTRADKAGEKSGDCAAIRMRPFRRARLSADDRRGAVPESAFEAKNSGFWRFRMAKVCPVQYGRRLAGGCGLWMKRERCKAKSAGEGGAGRVIPPCGAYAMPASARISRALSVTFQLFSSSRQIIDLRDK